MDITLSYNCFLKRPWIHMVDAVPSTLHQRIKFIMENRLICMAAEKDMIATTSTTTSYVEVSEEDLECSFWSMEFANATFAGEGLKMPTLCLSKVTRSDIKQIIGRGVYVGIRLGKKLQEDSG